MRFLSFTATAALLCAAVVLPVNAADNWAPKDKQKFTADCISSASTRVDAKQAEALCKCSATAAGNMSKSDLAKLNDAPSNTNEEVRARLLQETLGCRTKS